MAGSFCVICRRRVSRGSRCSRHRTVSPSSRSWHEPGAARTRRGVIDRDHGCVVCGSTENLQVHHVVAARDGGATYPENLIVLCRDHHIEAEKSALA